VHFLLVGKCRTLKLTRSDYGDNIMVAAIITS